MVQMFLKKKNEKCTSRRITYVGADCTRIQRNGQACGGMAVESGVDKLAVTSEGTGNCMHPRSISLGSAVRWDKPWVCGNKMEVR